MEGSGGGRVTPKAKGSGGGLGISKSGLGLTPKDPGQQGLCTTPGTGSSRPGGRQSEKGSGTQAAGSMDKMGEHIAA